MSRPAFALVVLAAAAVGACSERRSEPAESREPRPAREKAPDPGTPSAAAERVTFTTTDGVTLVATLRRGGEPEATAVVLVHQLSHDRSEWAPIVDRLARPPGLTTLALDMRGHGESTAGPDGRTLDWNGFDAAMWEATTLDVLAAVEYLAGHPRIEPARIVVVGSSIGGSAAIAAAAREPRIAAVAALSPGRAYHGFDAITPIPALGERPLLTVAAEEEAPAAETAAEMARIARAGRSRLYPGSAHGLAMLGDAPDLAGDLERFIREAR
jgi:dienelactone hydrolase